jgi:membrane-associated HD superfamily phosphohydrolase
VFSFLNEIRKYSETLKSVDIFNLKNGFSYSWLLILYLFGGYLGKFKIDINKKRNKYYYIKYIVLIIIFGLIKTKLLLSEIVKNNINYIHINYASPTYIGISISIVLIFSNINISNKILIKLISFFSSLTYGIYLSHNHLFVRLYIVRKYFLWILKYKSINVVIIEIMCSFGVFLFCGFIDLIRLYIFRFLKIKKLFVLLENKITIMADKLCSNKFS